MEYIGWIIAASSVAVTLYLSFHKEHVDENKDDKNLSIAFGKMDVKQDSILTAVNEMRLDQKMQNQKIAEIEKQVVIIDQSTKSAHHRIDDLINRKDETNV